MAKPQRTVTSGTFFITTITYNRRRLFQVPANASLFLETLQHYRSEGAYKLHAFVVMPDHAHLLLTPTDKTISQVMNLIKGGFSHRLASKVPFGSEDSPTISSSTATISNPDANTSIRTQSAPDSPPIRNSIPTPPRTVCRRESKKRRDSICGTRKRVPFRAQHCTAAQIPRTCAKPLDTPDKLMGKKKEGPRLGAALRI